MAGQTASYLSTYVNYILREIPKKYDDNLKKVKTCSGCTIKAPSFCLLLDEKEQDRRPIYIHNVRHIWSSIKSRELLYKKIPPQTINFKSLIPYLCWTGYTNLILECILEPVYLTNLSLLKLTVVLERALGDVFITFAPSKKCPSLLKDLLKTEELKVFFGSGSICFLQTLVGPPVSLNLRNVLWHGFPMLGEIPNQYCYILVELFLNLGKTLTQSQLASIKHRPCLKVPMAVLISDVFPLINKEKDLLVKVFKSTAFIPSGMFRAWICTLDLFFAQRYADAVILFLPQLEHALRCLFTVVNQCPNRLSTAESDVFYTTFDEILAKDINPNETNKLLPEIGKQLCELLYDLLYFPEGLRLRDRISHGEYAFEDIDGVIANHVISTGVCFCLKYLFPWRQDMKREYRFLANMDKAMEEYTSLYHPISLLKREIWAANVKIDAVETEMDEIQVEVEKYSGSFKEVEDITTLYMELSKSANGFLSFQEIGIDKESIKSCLKYITAFSREVLHRPKTELEINGILRNITRQCLVAADQVLISIKERRIQLEKKTMRSRARTNFMTMISVMPTLTSFWLTMLFAVSVESMLSSKMTTNQPNLTKYLKKCLKYTENITSLCSSSNNKWIECLTVISQMVETAKRRPYIGIATVDNK